MNSAAGYSLRLNPWYCGYCIVLIILDLFHTWFCIVLNTFHHTNHSLIYSVSLSHTHFTWIFKSTFFSAQHLSLTLWCVTRTNASFVCNCTARRWTEWAELISAWPRWREASSSKSKPTSSWCEPTMITDENNRLMWRAHKHTPNERVEKGRKKKSFSRRKTHTRYDTEEKKTQKNWNCFPFLFLPVHSAPFSLTLCHRRTELKLRMKQKYRFFWPKAYVAFYYLTVCTYNFECELTHSSCRLALFGVAKRAFFSRLCDKHTTHNTLPVVWKVKTFFSLLLVRYIYESSTNLSMGFSSTHSSHATYELSSFFFGFLHRLSSLCLFDTFLINYSAHKHAGAIESLSMASKSSVQYSFFYSFN